MNIIELIKHLDIQLFLIINGLHSPFFDNLMWVVSVRLTWIPLYLSVLYLFIVYFKKDAIWIILSVILCIVISDQIASGLLKELVKRLRPSHVESLKSVIHLVKGYEGGLYGFASSHAANSAGFAIITSLIFKDKFYTVSLLLWTFLVSYSRIYLGVHYPIDILGGVVIGTSIALFCFWLIQKFRPEILKNNSVKTKKITTKIPIIVLLTSYFGIIIYSIIS
jgi:undecaprenyl-diphosphatase